MADARKMITALILGVLAGLVAPELPGMWPGLLTGVYSFFGTIFLNALKMIIVPLVASSLIAGMAEIGGARGIGTLGLKTIFYYLATSLSAVITGLVIVNLLAPGGNAGPELAAAISSRLHGDGAREVAERVGNSGFGAILHVFLDMVPPNIVKAAADGQMLGIITFSLLFGYFIPRASEDVAPVLQRLAAGVHEIMISITAVVMRFAPLGVMCLVAKVVADAGASNTINLFKTLGLFAITVVAGLAVHAGITLMVVIRRVTGKNPLKHLKIMAPALATAFSTASSSATLPVTMECLETRGDIDKKTIGFVVPLGATINMDGTALYECVSALFIAQVMGHHMGVLEQFIVVWTALLTSIGVAGIPAASLVAIAIILKAVGLPVEAMAVILPVDRFLDMLRTAVNVFSDSVGAIVVSRHTD